MPEDMSIFNPDEYPTIWADLARIQDGWDHIADFYRDDEQEAEEEQGE
mgnify:CR=1 FL=1